VGDCRPDRGELGLRGRRTECQLLDGMIAAIRQGESRTLVVRGEAGVGKTALLEHVVEATSSDLRLIRTTGVESEMELPFAALHQLCAPMLDRMERLPRLRSARRWRSCSGTALARRPGGFSLG
jgi:ABC-type branched-subunit amino acid transport system ATPase component